MRPEKQLLLEDIKSRLEGRKLLMFVRYQKLNANSSANLRQTLVSVGGDFTVVGKRLLIKAANASGLSLTKEMLDGHIGVMYTDGNPIDATKAVFKFKKTHEESLELIGGQFEGKLCNASDLEQISKLPTLEVMRSQLLAVFAAPMSHTLSVMEALIASLSNGTENNSNEESSNN